VPTLVVVKAEVVPDDVVPTPAFDWATLNPEVAAGVPMTPICADVAAGVINAGADVTVGWASEPNERGGGTVAEKAPGFESAPAAADAACVPPTADPKEIGGVLVLEPIR
jgi:hypothetical protein